MRTLFVGLGILAILVGVVWTLQGANVLAGSFMSGNSFWLAVGIVLLIVGVLVSLVGVRAPRTRKAA